MPKFLETVSPHQFRWIPSSGAVLYAQETFARTGAPGPYVRQMAVRHLVGNAPDFPTAPLVMWVMYHPEELRKIPDIFDPATDDNDDWYVVSEEIGKTDDTTEE